MNRRYGRFSIPAYLVRNADPEVTRIMGSCSILRAESLLYSDTVEYMASSFRFREIAEGEIAPEYKWLFSDDGDMWVEEIK